MNPIDAIKAHWQSILLVIFVAFAVTALFIPGGILADDSVVDTRDDNPTNLEYGLGLDGGTRISAPPVGMTAEDIDVQNGQQSEVEQTLSDELDTDPADAKVRYNPDDDEVTAEMFTENVSQSEFAAALQEAGVDASEDDIRDGVTQTTRDSMIDTIETKINEGGLSGGSVYQSATVGGEYYIVVEVPDMDADELRELLEDRGIVEIRAYYPTGDGNQTNETVLRTEDIEEVDPPRQNQEGDGYQVPVQVTSEAAPGFQDQMSETGISGEGRERCRLSGTADDGVSFDHDGPQYCLLTVYNDEVVDAHSMSADLANSMQRGDWENDPSFFMGAPSQQQAQTLSISMRAGSLAAPMDFDQAQTYSIEPALADQFKTYSLLIGLLSVMTVSGVVYSRYTDARVAAPMILTAMAEVVILLGFAATIRMPLDLSHVAGFIAVVGTGVDDLVIIADEVMDEGDVSSQRVFQSRFRKAFWVIGAAAATTVVALSPLAVLSLGDLRGFAIITILGVFIGVLITRPAYGDILEYLLTDR